MTKSNDANRISMAVLLVLSAAYIVVYAVVPESTSVLWTIATIVPVAWAAWHFRFWGGMLTALVLFVAHFPVILLSDRTVQFWLMDSAGAYGYIALLLVAGVLGYMSELRSRLRDEREILETQDATIYALAYQAELRDRTTGRHIERTAEYVRVIATELATHAKFRDYMTSRYIEDIVKAAPLHDIGKVSVPDEILLKPGKLTPDEIEVMRRHSADGASVIQRAWQRAPFQSFLSVAEPLILTHHERWDGAGYPGQLRGESIPLSGRIMALADVYDALRSDRPYKEAFDHEKSRSIIINDRGTAFDPEIVDAFLAAEHRFREIAETHEDP